MSFFDVQLSGVRVTDEQNKFIKELRLEHPELYTSDSHVIRAALNSFMLLKKGKNKLKK